MQLRGPDPGNRDRGLLNNHPITWRGSGYSLIFITAWLRLCYESREPKYWDIPDPIHRKRGETIKCFVIRGVMSKTPRLAF